MARQSTSSISKEHKFPTNAITISSGSESDGDLEENNPLLAKSRTQRGSKTKKSKRGCTDILFLIFFLAYWVGLITLAVYSFTSDSDRSFAKYIKDGVDYQGHSCSNEKPYVYFPDIQTNPDFGICVDTCPTFSNSTIVVDLPQSIPDNANANQTSTKQVTFQTYPTHVWSYVCAPKHATQVLLIRQLQDNIGRFVGVLGDCAEALVMAGAISVITAAIYLLFLRYFGSFSIFFSTVGIQSILMYATYRLFQLSNKLMSSDARDPVLNSSLQLAAVALACASVLFFIFACMYLPRFLLAGTFIKHATNVLYQLKSLVLVPLLTTSMLVLVTAYGVIVMISIFGAGQTSQRLAEIHAIDPPTFQIFTQSFQVNTSLRWFALYHIWGMYWSVTFIISIGELITATAVSVWYFSEVQDHQAGSIFKHMRHRQPVLYALRSTFKYHLGTIALGSTVVMPVSYIRIITLQFDHDAQSSELQILPFINCITKACCCCVWCVKYCLKNICKESLYITAIQGANFFRGARLAQALIVSNTLRVGALYRIGHASVFLGKLIVCSATCLASGFLLQDKEFPFLPVVIILCFSYAVADAFMTIYETTINTLLMCFTLDENMHGGSGNAKFASAGLVRSVNDHLRPKWQTVL